MKIRLMIVLAVTIVVILTAGICCAEPEAQVVPPIVVPPVQVVIPTITIPTVVIPTVPIVIPTVPLPSQVQPDIYGKSADSGSNNSSFHFPDIQVPTAVPVETLDYRLFTEEITATPVPAEDSELYDEAMALYQEEKYYSARQAFIESAYGDWKEMADKCIRTWPSSGEIWHDRTQWLQDMELTINVDQPEDTAMFFRIYKNGEPVSYLFLAGPGSVTALLPGNAYYSIKDGVGRTWYGEKEAFGREGSYETMTFDDSGTEQVWLQTYYSYTLSINISSENPDANDVYSEYEDWENFTE